jgi:hypothetical protein
MVPTGLQLSDSLCIDVESSDRAFFPELDGKWQTNIAKTEDGEFYFV